MLVSGFLLVNVAHFGTVQASTHVSGVISADTTWTLANSPYVVTAPLLVDNGVVLTIEPGVTVYLNDTYMRVDGTLNAQGNIDEPISLICNGTSLGYLLSSIPAIEFSSESTNSIIENAVISSTHSSHTIYVDNASPKINNCTVINSADARAIYLESGAAIISNCTITAGDSMPGISCGSASLTGNDAQILDNTITDCGAGIAIYAGSPVVEGNLIANNTGSKNSGLGGIRIDGVSTSPTVRNNTIVGNNVGFNIQSSPSPTILFNNILGNIEYNVYLGDNSNSDINATYNWWGTTDVSAINQSIKDFKNDFNLGTVGFVPFLDEPNPYAPETSSLYEPEPEPEPEQDPNYTYVSGVLNSDTTWTLAGSPYFVAAPVLVNTSVVLTIEPGVTVHISEYYLRVAGTLNAKGTTENPISLVCNATGGIMYSFDKSAIQFTSTSISWNEQTGSGSILENAVISSSQNTHTVYIDNSSPKLNNCTVTNTGGQRSILIRAGAAIISNCSITSNAFGVTFSTDFAGVNDAQILDSTITDCDVGIEIYGGSPVVEGNLIADNTGNLNQGQGGIRIDHVGTSPTIRNNTIVGNSVGFNILDSPSPTIVHNNILDNLEYNVHLYSGTGSVSESDIDATYNWWGTTDVSAINQSIRDFKNDFNLGVVTFVPFLDEQNPFAPEVPAQPQPPPSPPPYSPPSPPPEPEPEPPAASVISILLDTSSNIVGSAVNINGKLTDINGTALQNKSITLSYSINGNEWVPIGSDTTNTAGEYAIQWVNTASGTFTLKAEWTGNDEYLAANATTTLSALPHQNQNIFFVESNSTVLALTFNSTNAELSFTVSGPSGSTGYVKATIPKDLLYSEGDWIVLVDEQQVTPTISEDANNTYLYFTYGHSTRTIEITGTEPETDMIPEFQSWILMPLLITATLLIIICKKRLNKNTPQRRILDS